MSEVWVLKVPYEERFWAQKNGAHWDSRNKLYTFQGETLPTPLMPYKSEDLSWERWQEEEITKTTHHRSPLSKTVKSDTNVSRFTLRPHQVDASRKITNAWERKARGFLLADDVGLGKTISTWDAVKNIGNQMGYRRSVNVLIVCPLSVVPHWRNTIQALGYAGLRVCVMNYDQIKKLLTVPVSAQKAKRTRTKNKHISNEGNPIVDWDIIIMDESHKLKNPSQRTKSMSRIAKYEQLYSTQPKPPFLIWMSATAGQNPLELSYLSPLLAQVTRSKFSSLKDFGPWLKQEGFHVEENPRWKKWEWTEDEKLREEDIRKMQQLLFQRKTPVALRRLPSQISGWPEIVRTVTPVDLGVKGKILYQTLWADFRSEMKLAVRSKKREKGLAAQLRFRQKASLLRVQGTTDFIVDMLDNNRQVAVSFQFLESLDAVKEMLEKKKIQVAVMDGRNPTGRESERLKFQKGVCKVVLFTPVEGFSLHQSEQLADGTRASSEERVLIIHDPRYSGIETLQIEGRTHRDGKNANAYYMYSENTVEEEVVKKLTKRVTSTKALVGDDITVLNELIHTLNAKAIPNLSQDWFS